MTSFGIAYLQNPTAHYVEIMVETHGPITIYVCVCLCLCVITHSSKGLVISRHNASTDQLVNLLNPCTRTKHFTPINPCTQNNMITPHRHGSFDGFAIPQDAHTLLN